MRGLIPHVPNARIATAESSFIKRGFPCKASHALLSMTKFEVRWHYIENVFERQTKHGMYILLPLFKYEIFWVVSKNM